MMSGILMQRLRRSNSVEALGDSSSPSSADTEMDEVRREPERINTRQRFDSQSSTSSSDVDGIVDARDNTHENSAVDGAEQQEETQHVVSITTGTILPGPSRAQKRTRFGTITQATVQETPQALGDSSPPSSADTEMNEVRRGPDRINTRQRFDSQSSTSSSEETQHVIATTTGTNLPGPSRRQQENIQPAGNQVDENKFIVRDWTHFPQELEATWLSKQAPKDWTHFPQELEATWLSKQAPKVIIKDRKKDSENELEELFKGTEQQVLYKVNNRIQELMQVNAVISKETLDGLLHKAVNKKFVKVAERLLDNGASLHYKNRVSNKCTPLELALGIDSESSEDDEENCRCSWFESIKEYIKHNCFGEDKDSKTDQKEQNTGDKCDEMAALMISKLHPNYVRHLFGDNTDFDKGAISEENVRDETFSTRETTEENVRSEPANIRFTGYTSITIEDHTHETPQEHTTARSIEQKSDFNSLSFLKIVQDKNMLKTAITILDKLEDTDHYTKQPVVYSNLLLKRIDKKEDELVDTNHDTKQPEVNCNLLLNRNDKNDKNEKKEDTIFQYIVRRRQELIGHPVVRAVIHYKWTRQFHRRYLIDFFEFLVSFIAITICAVVGAQSDHIKLYNTPWQYARAALEILMCIFIFESLWLECLQFSVDSLAYVKSILNWIEFGSALCLVISIGLRYGDVNAHWYVFAVGYVFWTIKGLKYCAIYRHGDAYKETLRALVKRDLVLFIMFFVALEMLFGGTLLLVLRGTNALYVEPDTQSILSIYYIGLLTAVDGQAPESLNVDNLPRIALFVINVFNVLTIVVMLNILIAQMTNTYEIAYLEGQIKSWVNRAEAIVSYEKEDEHFESTDGCFGICVLYGKLRNACTCRLKKYPEHGRIPFDKEKLLEEKEKVDEMRAILKQVDKTLLHTDLSVHTIKSKQTAQLQDKNESPESTTYGSPGQSDLPRYAEKLTTQFNELKAQQENMKKQQEAMKDSILEAVGEIRKLLQKQE